MQINRIDKKSSFDRVAAIKQKGIICSVSRKKVFFTITNGCKFSAQSKETIVAESIKILVKHPVFKLVRSNLSTKFFVF